MLSWWEVPLEKGFPSLCPLPPAGPGAGTAPAPSRSAHSAAAPPRGPAGPRPRPDCLAAPHAPGPGCPAAVAGLAAWPAGTEPGQAGREVVRPTGLGPAMWDKGGYRALNPSSPPHIMLHLSMYRGGCAHVQWEGQRENGSRPQPWQGQVPQLAEPTLLQSNWPTIGLTPTSFQPQLSLREEFFSLGLQCPISLSLGTHIS